MTDSAESGCPRDGSTSGGVANTYQGGEGGVSLPTTADAMTINRVPAVPFAQIANAALRDKRLSFKARGILAMVLSNVGEWEATANWIEAQSDKDGRDAVQSALKELTALGYRIVRHERDRDGTLRTITEWRHIPEAESTDLRETRPPDNPTTGESGQRVTRPSIEHHPLEHHLPEHHPQNSPGAAAPGETEGQRVNRLTRIYADRVPMVNFPAVAGIVRKAVRAGLWADDEIGDALARLGDEGRAVTTDSLRYELVGFAGPRSNRERQLRDGITLARDLAQPDPWAARELEAGDK